MLALGGIEAGGTKFVCAVGHPPDDLDLAEIPSNCTFGDSDLRTLYITARTGLYRARRDVKGALQY